MLLRSLLLCVVLGTPALVRAQDAPADTHDGYAWAEACKSCHKDIYDAWEKTKHARALSKLNDSERRSECVLCHITAGEKPEISGGKTLNANVQCEACHGPAKAHAEAANAGNPMPSGLARYPEQKTCERCHNAKSPKFKGFFFRVMAPLSHRVSPKS